MVVTPERRMSACVLSGKGLGLVAVMYSYYALKLVSLSGEPLLVALRRAAELDTSGRARGAEDAPRSTPRGRVMSAEPHVENGLSRGVAQACGPRQNRN